MVASSPDGGRALRGGRAPYGSCSALPARLPTNPATQAPRLSDALERWLTDGGKKTVGSLIEVFAEKSFAVLFVVLLSVPALPAPTGGVTHVFEIIAALLALQLIAGRDQIWLPGRWRERELAVVTQERFLAALLKLIRRLERVSKPRLRSLFHRRASGPVFGLLALGGCVGAFLAPPFTGLDTLPALGVVVLSIGVLLEDFAVAILGVVIGAVGIALEILLGKAALDALGDLL